MKVLMSVSSLREEKPTPWRFLKYVFRKFFIYVQ